MKNKIIAAVIVIVLLSLTAWGVKRYILAQEAKRIELTGSVETTEVEASFQVPGKIQTLLVDEGDSVKAGQLLAALDPKDYLQQKNAALAALKAAQTQLPQLETKIQLSQEQNAGQVNLAQAGVGQSSQRLAELKNGYRAQEITKAEKDRAAAASTLKMAKKDWRRAENLYKDDALSGQQRDAAKTNYQVALARYQQASAQYDMLKEGNRTEDIGMGASQLAQSQANLQLAQASRPETETLVKQRKTLEAQIKQAEANFKFSQNQLNHTRLYAPISGVVLVKPREAGEVIASGTPVVTLGNLQKLWLKAYINETDIGKVKLGQKVAVSTDSYPGKTYHGEVYYISSQAEFTPKNLQTKEDRVKLVYRIKVSLENPEQELKPGMIADGVIKLADSGAEGK